MDLDDQLAALAAGELDARDAQALRARVAADPALARRLVRIERLDGVLRGWSATPMPSEAAARLDATVAAALAALGDTPLDDGSVPTAVPLSSLGEPATGAGAEASAGPASGGGDRTVVDLAAARARRGLPGWVAGAAVAAAVLGVVAVGVGPGSPEPPAIMADGAPTDAEAGPEENTADGAPADAEAATGPADGAVPTATDDTGQGLAVEEGLVLDATTLASVVAAEPVQQLLASGGAPEVTTDASSAGDPGGDGSRAFGAEEAASTDPARFGRLRLCTDAALEATPDRVVALVGTGTYEGVDAIVVVLVGPSGPDGVPVDVLAYDAATCVLLDQLSTTG